MGETTLDDVKERLDLLVEMEKDLGPGRKSGRWVQFRCPFPGHEKGDKTGSLFATPENGRFHCFGGCGQSGDVITWLREYRKLGWKEIFHLVDGGELPDSAQKPHRPKPQIEQPSGPPPETWQERALAFVETCEKTLWSPDGQSALAYLRRRGLRDDTIRHYRLGYCPGLPREPLEMWGLPADPDSKGIWLPRGIVIPCWADNVLWYVNIRRPVGEPKYYKISGSKSALFGVSNLRSGQIAPIDLLVEGEFDCMLADQEIGDVVGCATLGGNATHLNVACWGRYLLPARVILAAYDSDGKSDKGLAALVGASAQIHPVRVPVLRPGDKDITDYVLAGGNLWEWVKYCLEQLDLLDDLVDQPLFVESPPSDELPEDLMAVAAGVES